jgi:16S rRNA (cytosine1402-N4)-methyltransferase
MLSEVCQYLVSNPTGLFVDATFGGGGHSFYLLEKFPDLKIIAFDWDGDAQMQFQNQQDKFGDRLIFIRDNFKNIKQALADKNLKSVDGILADVGVSSKQFDDKSRGFSFNSNVIDMRMDQRKKLTAKEIINSYPESELADIFYKFGQERFSRQIASAVVARRQRGSINTSQELRDLVFSVKKFHAKIDPSTQVFQALRIFVNDELGNLEKLLSDAPSLLNPAGRIVIISFHSLEDTVVKNNFRQNAKENVYDNLTKKVIFATQEEISKNPRSSSAKLRAAQKI